MVEVTDTPDVVDLTDIIMDRCFCTLINDNLSEHGVVEGDLVYVVGSRFMPIDGGPDPYTYLMRNYMILSRTDESGLPIYPDGPEDKDNCHLLADPDSLKKVDDDRQKELLEQESDHYGEVVEQDERTLN